MAGAIAGTVILNTKPNKKLQLVTLTVNNCCNLNCGHCYLQNGQDNSFVDDKTIDKVIESGAKHIAIVGKEPLLDLDKTTNLIYRLHDAGKKVSLVTNGILLHKLDKNALGILDYVDISMDGGPKTYSRGDYNLIERNLILHRKTNVLHTIYKENLDNINDMLRVSANIMLFSPYLVTQNSGNNSVTNVGLSDLLNSFSASNIRDYPNAKLGLDTYYAEQEKTSFNEIQKRIKEYKLKQNTFLFKNDSLEYGIIRVTFDGKLLSPKDSLHTNIYVKSGKSIKNIDSQFEQMLMKSKM